MKLTLFLSRIGFKQRAKQREEAENFECRIPDERDHIAWERQHYLKIHKSINSIIIWVKKYMLNLFLIILGGLIVAFVVYKLGWN